MNTSRKQKLNTRSSTEAELVAVDDMASQVMWTNYFLQKQGYFSNGCIVCQDNKSALLLESNGHFSRGKRSKHISVRYFFIKDRVDAGEVELQWCYATEMIGDFLRNPFRVFSSYSFGIS